MNLESNNQPKALYLLFFVQMWECFSYYGMRVLLVLYMTSRMGFSDTQAFGIFAIYCALVEFGGVFGGRLADRILGQRPAIFFGGWLIALGHICMALADGENFLYASLGMIAAGSGLFSSNVSSLLGMYYEKEDPRREEGYTLFYIGMNLGAVLATVVCGIVAELYGWHAGFGLAALGMILGNAALLLFRGCLEGKGDSPSAIGMKIKALCIFGIFLGTVLCMEMIRYQTIMMVLLPFICLGIVAYAGAVISRNGGVSGKMLLSLGGYLTVLTLFFAAEEQIGGSLLLYCERFANGTFLGVSIPASMIVGINPFLIITCGMGVSKLANFAGLSGGWRLMLGCLIGAGAFALISLSSVLPEISLLVVVAGVAMLSLGELLIGPTVYAAFSEAAPQNLQGMTMGLIPIGFSLSTLLSGLLNQSMALDAGAGGVELYTQGFAVISVMLLTVGICVGMINYKKEVIYEVCRIS